MRPLRILLIASFCLAVGAVAATRARAAPEVVVTLKPIHSLVAGVMEGVGRPALLLGGATTPHSYVLRPSDARRLNEADLVFWVGPELETFLVRPLRALGGEGRVVTLAQAPGVAPLPTRGGGLWEARHAASGEPDHGRTDMHVWLDPGNAKAIVRAAAAALADIDADNAAGYRANAERLTARINALDRDLDRRLAPVRSLPYLVFHDAYQYFERHYGLSPVGAVSTGPERPPGARRVYEVRRRIAERDIRCVFTEPQFRPALVRTVVEGTPARIAVLDPLGADIEAGPEAWFILMRRLGESLLSCLGEGG